MTLIDSGPTGLDRKMDLFSERENKMPIKKGTIVNWLSFNSTEITAIAIL